MLSRYTQIAIVFGLLLAITTSLTAAPAPLLDDKIKKWIADLGSRQFSLREQAEQNLWKAGEFAEPFLKRAALSEDKEVSRRAKAILEKFKWGLYPATPEETVKIINQYRASSTSKKVALVDELLDQGEFGCKALLKITEAETNANLQKSLYQRIGLQAGRAIPSLAARKNFGTLDKLMDRVIEHDMSGSINHYIAYIVLRDKLEQRIKYYADRLSTAPPSTSEFQILLYLYRAKGEFDKAKTIAKGMNNPAVYRNLLMELGDWKSLSDNNIGLTGGTRVEDLGFRAAFHRLAGKDNEFDKAIADIISYASNQAKGSSDIWNAAKALFLNNRHAEGFALMDSSQRAETHFTFLVTQRMYQQAFELVDAAEKEGHRSLNALLAQRARYQYVLGEKEKALKTFNALEAKVAPGDSSWHESFLESVYRAGLLDKALELGDKMLSATKSLSMQISLIKVLFKGREEKAHACWKMLIGNNGKETSLARMKFLRQLFSGTAKVEKVKDFITKAQQQIETQGLNDSTKTNYYLALSEVALAHKLNDIGREMLLKASGSDPTTSSLITLGDQLVKNEKWEEAAHIYNQAWENDKSAPLPLYLRGWALVKAGREEDGAQWQQLAHWLPMGQEDVRIKYARELAKRGLRDVAEQERRFVLRSGKLGDFNVGEAQRQLGILAASKKDYAKAVEGHERAMLRVIRSFIYFLEEKAYVTVPEYIHSLKAKAHIQAGDLKKARKHLEACQTLLPRGIDLATEMMPLLEKKGYKDEAKQLFEQTKKTQAEMCKLYPESASCHNTFAWLCAVCKRDLEDGLTHAQAAVKLDSDNAGYRDTLAEVLFQQGKKELAIAEMKKCLEQAPRRSYYKEQLRRFEKGDRNAPLPKE